jgi:hypothetical protein
VGKMNKSIISLILISMVLIFSVEAAPIIYSGKFRINTALESSNIIEVPVYIKDAVDLYAFKLDVTYDNPNILSFNDVVPGTLLSSDGTTLIDGKTVGLTTSSSGHVNNILVSRSSVETGVTGSGLLFTLKFNKVSSGISDLTFSNIEVSDSNANAITDFNVYYLVLWDDTDTGTKYPNQPVIFYASYENKNGEPVTGTCSLTVEGNAYQMTYDSANQLYKYSKSFTTAGDKTWSVTCDSFVISSDKAAISVQQCQDADGDGSQALSCGGTDCNDNNASIKPGGAEICNNADDNCIGGIDESLSRSCSVNHFGNCAAGTEACNAGFWSGCPSPLTEVCGNAIDENCNGQNEVCPGTCNDLDNDKYGNPGSSLCQFAQQDCNDTIAAINPGATEICDIKDNDCDGIIDENVKNLCYDYSICQTYETCSSCLIAPSESCDGKDNNCNGETDEGCSCTNGVNQSCGVSGIGECKLGIQTCSNGNWNSCSGSVLPTNEKCDKKDNNCDGEVDEDACSNENPSSSSSNELSVCNELWVCEPYGDCAGGFKERTCDDQRNCGTVKNKPETKAGCNDLCADEIQDNEEEGIDCGGNCKSKCLIIEKTPISNQPISNQENKNYQILVNPENIKKSTVNLVYDNSKGEVKTGVQFNIQIKDTKGSIVAEEYFGPIKIEEKKYFSQEYNMPLYALKKNQEYQLNTVVSEKGKQVAQIQSRIVLNEVPQNVFFSRIYLIFGGVVLFILVVIVIFSMLFKRGESK